MNARIPISALLFALALSLPLQPAQARKIKTRHSVQKVAAKTQEMAAPEKDYIISMESDSVAFCECILPAIRFYGFDKTVGSSNESFFISNALDEAVSRLQIEIIYTDMKGRQLHRREVTVDCDLPAGETKRTDIKSWDTQKSFYFHQSVAPRRQATPFDVRLRLISATFPHQPSR